MFEGVEYNPFTGDILFDNKVLGYVGTHGYVALSFKGIPYLAHRLAWFLTYKYWPVQVDHINRIRLDNRLINLREVNQTQNNLNASLRHDSKTGVKGVCFDKVNSKYKASIMVKGKHINLGRYNSIEEAQHARLSAERKYWEEAAIGVDKRL